MPRELSLGSWFSDLPEGQPFTARDPVAWGATTQWGRRARQLWGEGSEGLLVQTTWLSPPALGRLCLGATRAEGERLGVCVAGRVGGGPGGGAQRRQALSGWASAGLGCTERDCTGGRELGTSRLCAVGRYNVEAQHRDRLQVFM